MYFFWPTRRVKIIPTPAKFAQASIRTSSRLDTTRSNTPKVQTAVIFFMMFLLFSPSFSQAKIKKQAQLPIETVTKVNLILRVNEALHAALVSRNEALIEAQIQALELAVEDSLETLVKRDRENNRQIASHPQLHDKNLHNMLSDIRRALKSAHTNGGSKRRDYLRDSFRQVALLTKLYQISHPYKIYFCKTDRSVWLQRGSRPQNPILADSAPTCGIPVK